MPLSSAHVLQNGTEPSSQLCYTTTIPQLSAWRLKKLEFATYDREMVEIACQTMKDRKCR